jgi:hypothetical protein
MMDIESIRGDGKRAEVKGGGEAGGGKESGVGKVSRGLGPEGAVIVVVISPWMGDASAKHHAEEHEQGRGTKLPGERTGSVAAGNQVQRLSGNGGRLNGVE